MADFCKVFFVSDKKWWFMAGHGGKRRSKKPPEGASEEGTKVIGGWNCPPLYYRGLAKNTPRLERSANIVRETEFVGRLVLLAGSRLSVVGPRSGTEGSGWNGELKEAEKCYIGQLGSAIQTRGYLGEKKSANCELVFYKTWFLSRMLWLYERLEKNTQPFRTLMYHQSVNS